MTKNEGLISSAMLTAIWETSEKDNIDLLIPFVKFILADNFTKGNKIDVSFLSKKMEKNFYFSEFPDVVIKKVLNRLSKNKNRILKREREMYYLLDDLEQHHRDFYYDRQDIEFNIEKVIKELIEYLKKSDKKYKNIGDEDIINLLVNFLDTYGYTTYKNIDDLKDITKFKHETDNYYIGKFILDSYEKQGENFKSINNIITGFMLSKAIYIQIDNDNSRNMRNLEVYFDSPLMLNVLGFKTDEQNNSARQLINLLKDKGAKIKLFKHNYQEIENILENYIKNIGKITNKTLEGLQEMKYTKSELDNILIDLKNIIEKSGIQIVDTPKYDEIKAVIGEEELSNFIRQNYSGEINDMTLQNDVRTIASIYRIRKSQENFRTLEESKAIFVTTNYSLVNSVNTILEVERNKYFGSAISDNELIVLVWLKSYKTNPDLPKDKLIENARIAIQPTTGLMNKFIDIAERMKICGKINEKDISEKIVCNHYLKKELMEATAGDSDRLDEDIVMGIIEQEKLNAEKMYIQEQEKNNKLQEKVKENNEFLISMKREILDKCKLDTNYITNMVEKTFIQLINIIYFFIILISIYGTIINLLDNKINIFYLLFAFLGIFGIADSLTPRFGKIKKIVSKLIKKLNYIIYIRKIEKQKSVNPKLFL